MNEIERANSIVGYSDARDVHYRAPEVCLKEGHELAADLWSFGVIVFEMFTGKSPLDLMGTGEIETLLSYYKFSEKMVTAIQSESDASDLSERIKLERMHSKPQTQDYRLQELHSRMLSNENYFRSLESIGSAEGKNFIRVLLCVEPYERWPFARPLTHHDFFRGVDMESIVDGNTFSMHSSCAYCPQDLFVPIFDLTGTLLRFEL